jgi:hypothetical protein
LKQVLVSLMAYVRHYIILRVTLVIQWIRGNAPERIKMSIYVSLLLGVGQICVELSYYSIQANISVIAVKVRSASQSGHNSPEHKETPAL